MQIITGEIEKPKSYQVVEFIRKEAPLDFIACHSQFDETFKKPNSQFSDVEVESIRVEIQDLQEFELENERRKERMDCIVTEIDPSALRKRERELTLYTISWANVVNTAAHHSPDVSLAPILRERNFGDGGEGGVRGRRCC